MTVLELLAKEGPCTALYMARTLGMLLGDVYGELVAAEARGDVVIRIDRNSRAMTTWALRPGKLFKVKREPAEDHS